MFCLVNTYSPYVLEPVFDLKNMDSEYIIFHHENKVFVLDTSSGTPSQVFSFVLDRFYSKIASFTYKFLYRHLYIILQDTKTLYTRFFNIFLDIKKVEETEPDSIFKEHAIYKATYTRTNIVRILTVKNNFLYSVIPYTIIDKSIVRLKFGIPYIVTYIPHAEYKIDNNTMVVDITSTVKMKIGSGVYIDTTDKEKYKVV